MNDRVKELAEKFGVRPFAPLAEDHPMASEPFRCPVCDGLIEVGEVMCLLVFDSDYNRAEAEKAQGAYNAEADPAHWTCVTGSGDPVGDFERWYSEAQP